VGTITIGELDSGDGRTLPMVEFNATFEDPPTELRFRIRPGGKPGECPLLCRRSAVKK